MRVLSVFRQEREAEQAYASGEGAAPLNHDGEVDPQITNEASCRVSIGHLIRLFGLAGLHVVAAAPDPVQPFIRPVNPLSKLLEQLFSFSDDFCYPGPPP